MPTKTAVDVARRCICLELMFQRLALEEDDDEAAERDRGRAMWLSKVDALAVTDVLLAEERAFLERPVGELSDDDLDDVHGRASGAPILLWALGRLEARPSMATVEAIAETLGAHGLLGDGSIRRARSAAEEARLRADEELDAALGTYLRTRGKAREVTDPERVFAEVAAHHVAWVRDAAMGFDDDLARE
jgi:hypothetical protein